MYKFATAIIITFILTVICGKIILPYLRRLKIGQHIKENGPQEHKSKEGTPMMGGFMFIIPIALSLVAMPFLGGDFQFILVPVLMMLACAAIGFVDDYIKVVKKRNLGLKAYQKVVAQLVVSGAFALYAYLSPAVSSTIFIPFTDITVDLGIWYIPLIMIAVIATTNSTNITDGLDGLLSSITLVFSCGMAAILVLMSTVYYAASPADSENMQLLLTLAGCVMGGCLGFLVYNAHPAKVFMGDTGSFAFGGILVAMCVMMKMPLLIVILGFVYVFECISVFLQVGYFKATGGKRLFLMAPVHHHFQKKGYKETKVVLLFTLVQGIMSVIALLSVMPLFK